MRHEPPTEQERAKLRAQRPPTKYSLIQIALEAGVQRYVARRLLIDLGRVGSKRSKHVRLWPTEREAVVATLRRQRRTHA